MNTYILIPDIVKISKIPAGAKILYGDILMLSKVKGYCFASNNFFADIYGVHVNSITNWINFLKINKFINTKYKINHEGRSTRRLYPTEICGNKHKKLWSKKIKTNNGRNKTKVVI